MIDLIMSKKNAGFSEILIIVIVVALVAAGSIFYFASRGESTSLITQVSPTPMATQTPESTTIPTSTSTATYSPTPKPTQIPSEILPIDFISYQLPNGWDKQIKRFGEENTLQFPSHYTPSCKKDSCAGIRLTKENAKLEMVFNFAYDSGGLICTANEDYFTNLSDNWARINYPTSKDDTYQYRYSYIHGGTNWAEQLVPKDQSNGDWYFPDLTSRHEGSGLLFCAEPAPLFRSQAVQKHFETAEGYEIPAIVATSPRLYSTDGKDISQELLDEVDGIIKSIKYSSL